MRAVSQPRKRFGTFGQGWCHRIRLGQDHAPLADQLNHDVTHLQGERLEARLGQLADEIRNTLARLDSSPAMTTSEDSARTGNAISGRTSFWPGIQGHDIRVTVLVRWPGRCGLGAGSGKARLTPENPPYRLDEFSCAVVETITG